jgi:O-acetyl-ADP-ribose deacetylase (regulator of RNase III)
MVIFEHREGEVSVEIAYGDIASQKGIDAVVNAANSRMASGGGVSGAIHRGAGAELWEECKKLPALKPGEVAITKAYNLPNQYVIHCLGPRYGIDEPHEALLTSCYRRAFDGCDEYKLTSIAFPAISTGAFYYPWKEAATVAFQTTLRTIKEFESLSQVRFVYHDEAAAEKHVVLLQRLLSTSVP